MIRVEEMGTAETLSLLQRIDYGHLACSRDNIPYIVPIHYVYKEPDIFIFTTEGKKTEIIDGNPEVCLQIEEVTDEKNWQSVIITGKAVQLTNRIEISDAMELIRDANPELTPALSIRWMDQWVRVNRQLVYRISPAAITGRTTVN